MTRPEVMQPTSEEATTPAAAFDASVEGAAIHARARRVRQRQRIEEVGLRGGAVVTVLVVWHLISLRLPAIILPSPIDVIQTVISNFPVLVSHGRTTMYNVFVGFAIGGGGGFLLGVIMAHSVRAEAVLRPFVVLSQSVPKSALAPLFILWLGFGAAPKIAIAAAISFFPLLENTTVGLRRIDPAYLRLFTVSSASSWDIFWKLRIINAAPYVLTSCRVGIIFALVGAIVAEFISGHRGLGALIIIAQGDFNAQMVFAVLVALSAIGSTLYGTIRIVERMVMKRLHLGEGIAGKSQTA